MTLWNKLKTRFHSWAVWTALLALIAFVTKEWLGWEIPGWDQFVTLLLAFLAAFGIINNPDTPEQF